MDRMKALKAGLLIAAASMLTGASVGEPAYPAGFQDWHHLHSGVVMPDSPFYGRFGGIHDTYGNAIAMRGYPKGHYADGSIFVFDVHHEVSGKGSVEPVSRRQLDVMLKKAGKWSYFEFKGDSHVERSVTVEQGKAECAACHEQAPHDHVFRDEDSAPSTPAS